jgi:predicted molibdopterin-dependent oxidoreductase YjgC
VKDLRIQNVVRKESVTLLVNGKKLTAYKGETVLSALIASGVKTLRKSSVVAENRGALCGMGVCFECLITINGIPNCRACMVEVQDKMEIVIDE